jgi:HJR/Mrr/RecB family endonuclease
MAKQKDSGGCGALLLLFAVLCAIEDWIKENYEKICITLGIIIAIIVIYIFYKQRKKKRSIQLAKEIEETYKNNTFQPNPERKTYEVDPHFVEAAIFAIQKGEITVGKLQVLFKIGFNRADRIMEQLYITGVVGAENREKKRKSLMSMDSFQRFLNTTNIIEPQSNKESSTLPKSDRVQLYNGKYDYMEGHDFEKFCAELLAANGFSNVYVTQESNDQGIDVLAEKLGVKYAVQCKRYSSDVGNKAVQEVFAGKSYYGCHVGVVLTNRYFTQSAKELAEKTQVFLWDRDALEKLIQNANM